MTDSIKFVDMLHNVPWEDGLPNDTRDGELSVCLNSQLSCLVRKS